MIRVVKSKFVLILMLATVSSVLMGCDDFFNLVRHGGNDIGPSAVRIYNLRYHAYKDGGNNETAALEFTNFSVEYHDASIRTFSGRYKGSDKFSETSLNRVATIAAMGDRINEYADGLLSFFYEFEKYLAKGSDVFIKFKSIDSMSYNSGISITETALLDDTGQISSTKFTKQDFIDALNPDGNLIKIIKGSDTYIYIEQEDEGGKPKITVEYKPFVQ